MTNAAYNIMARAVATVGDPDAVLLAGPAAGSGAATLAAHTELWGEPPSDRAAILTAIEDGDLRGRGGGHFPAARKIRAVREAVARSGSRPRCMAMATTAS